MATKVSSVTTIHRKPQDGQKGDKGDTPQPNLYGYDTFVDTGTSSDVVMHTATGFAAVVTVTSGGYVFCNIWNGSTRNKYAQGTILAASCKIRISDINSGKSAFTVGLHIGNDGQCQYIEDVASTPVPFAVKGTMALDYQIFIAVNAGTAYVGKQILIEVTNLKIENASNILGTSTPFSALCTDSIPVHTNMLNGTRNWGAGWEFTEDNIYSIVDGYNNTKALRCVAPSTWNMFARQYITLQPNTTYTASFYAMSDIEGCNINIGITGFTNKQKSLQVLDCCTTEYRDSDDRWLGVNTHYIGTTWTLHTLTFRTGSDVAGTPQLYIYSHPNITPAGRVVYLSQMKLEEGDKPTAWQQSTADVVGKDGANGSTLNWMLWSEVKDTSRTFYDRRDVGNGLYLSDVVIDDTADTNYKYRCIKQYDYTAGGASPASDPTHWEQASDLGNIATSFLMSDEIQAQVLAAVNARINNLILNRAQATDADGNVTVSIDGTTGKLDAAKGNFGVISICDGTINNGTTYEGIISRGDKLQYNSLMTLNSDVITFRTKEGSDDGVQARLGNSTVSASTGFGDVPLFLSVNETSTDSIGAVIIAKGSKSYMDNACLHLEASEGRENYAIHAVKGCYSGFRFRMREITTKSATLDIYSNFIYINISSVVTLTLPSDAEVGQVIYIRSRYEWQINLTGGAVMGQNSTVYTGTNVYISSDIARLINTLVKTNEGWLLNW